MSGTEAVDMVESEEPEDPDDRDEPDVPVDAGSVVAERCAWTGITSRRSEALETSASSTQTARWWSEVRRTESPSGSMYLSLEGVGKCGATRA